MPVAVSEYGTSIVVNIRSHRTGPYDAIHVGAAAPTLPQTLVDQLASPGSMFIPVGEHYQQILQVNKDENGNVIKKELMGVRVSSIHIGCAVQTVDSWSLAVCAVDRS